MTSESSSTTGSAGAVPVFMSATNRAGLLADAKELAVEIAKSAYSMKEIAHMVSERQDSTLAYRLFTLVSNCDALAQVDEAEIIHATTKAPVVFVFSGQIGSNPKISTELYRQNESIRNSLVRITTILDRNIVADSIIRMPARPSARILVSTKSYPSFWERMTKKLRLYCTAPFLPAKSLQPKRGWTAVSHPICSLDTA